MADILVAMRALAMGVALALPAPALLAEVVQTEAPAPAAPGTALASDSALRHLGEVMQIADLIAIMQQEGLDYGRTLQTQMFPDADPAAWEAEVARIYDPARMKAGFDAALAQALAGDGATIAAAEAFFAPARGQKILGLELEARRALLDDAVEAAARDAARQMQEDGAPRYDLLRRFADTNDLVELNVMGALNANLAFYKGLSRGGAFDQPMSESDMLAEVWGQEADVRVETEEWLWPYLSLAYGPLSDEELQAYIGFSGSDAGQRLNAAIFAAFDALFNDISMQLGLAAARQLQGQDI